MVDPEILRSISGRATESGQSAWDLCAKLFPIPRSLTGDGVRETLRLIAEQVPGLRMHEIPTGTRFFDWEIPQEWNIRGGFVADMAGNRIIDWADNTLHVVGYSDPIDAVVDAQTLNQHLYSLPDQPDAIPYITSYYWRTWGFCLSERQRQLLTDSHYRVCIDSTLAPGALTYADLVIPGQEATEVMLSTYVCHPSMANNELSGPALVVQLARWLLEKPRRLTYRILFTPETIGAIAYLGQHLPELKRKVAAGFQITCVGDDRTITFLPSRQGGTLPDRIARHVLDGCGRPYQLRNFVENRGSDERQYCSPGVDLPFVSITRSMYAEYPEYHTSLDDLSLVTPGGFALSFEIYARCIAALEMNLCWRATYPCEPHMVKHGLFPKTGGGTQFLPDAMKLALDVLAYADGTLDCLGMADLFKRPVEAVFAVGSELERHGLLKRVVDTVS